MDYIHFMSSVNLFKSRKCLYPGQYPGRETSVLPSYGTYIQSKPLVLFTLRILKRNDCNAILWINILIGPDVMLQNRDTCGISFALGKSGCQDHNMFACIHSCEVVVRAFMRFASMVTMILMLNQKRLAALSIFR